MKKIKKTDKGQKPKTRWGCLITILIIILVLGGGGYFFYTNFYPGLINKNQNQNNFSAPKINKEGEDKINGAKSFGTPINNNEATGRSDPFAPI